MTTAIVLLRGVNVGGNNNVRMADLRTALEDRGFDDVRTYIQSGNIVAQHRSRSMPAIAREVEAVIAEAFGVDVPAIALTRPQLLAVQRDNPFTDEPDPRRVHAIFLPAAPPAEHALELQTLAASLRERGSRDALAVLGSVVYLHTPDGFGTSDLAKALTAKSSRLTRGGTARNWATVQALVDLST